MLNGLTPTQFLRRHWQKKPLLVRGGMPCAADLVKRDELFELAQLPESEARLVMRIGNRWNVTYGPFRKRDFVKLPPRNWTLLVQGVNLALPRAQQMLSPFAFIPYARLDDLMVSYAPPGGGVGPHFDSYDVFLVQGGGQRRWLISTQRDLSLVKGAPLKILRDFRASREWTLTPGDMLYLPPRCAHNGIATADCITYSIGFRAPSAQDLCGRFFDFLADRLDATGHYADPQLRPTRQPARIDPQMSGKLLGLLNQARWTREDLLHFIGTDLSTPKPQVTFSSPRRPLSRTAFSRAATRGLYLDVKTILLYDTRAFYINGSREMAANGARKILCRLADRKMLRTVLPSTPATALDVMYDWYRAGYLHPGPAPQ